MGTCGSVVGLKTCLHVGNYGVFIVEVPKVIQYDLFVNLSEVRSVVLGLYSRFTRLEEWNTIACFHLSGKYLSLKHKLSKFVR